ncbi:MAG: hypothetical protein FWC20_08765 [Oscillospiraceae bacterium]|nr:hypothetical protein [Oscillospiraceae bacterium]
MRLDKKWELPADCPIEPKWFYQFEKMKNKFAWFLYEFACAYYNKITESRKKRVSRWVKEQSDMQLADYCSYYSKRLQKDLIELIEGISNDISCHVDYVYEYCHRTDKELNLDLVFLAQEAMVGLFEICNTCPVQCLDDPGGYCDFFDRYN